MRTATLDLNSRGSFVDDLNSKPGIVMCRDALLHRSHEIQPAFFDSEIFFPLFSLRRVDVGRGTCAARWPVGRAQWYGERVSRTFGRAERSKKIFAPPPGIEPGTCRLTADRSANGALEAFPGREI